MQAFATFNSHDESLIEFVNTLLEDAITQTVSDVHLEPYSNQYRVRYRRDGILSEKTFFTHEFATRMITRLKVMAKLDITEQRMPQDGRFQYQSTYLRISSCPTMFGEKIVLRLLCHQNNILRISELGFSDYQLNQLMKTIIQPNGMIIVTGPTSSGKTATLYAILDFLNNIQKNIITIEDPVEIQLDGINQLNVQSKINLTFANLLRSVLRQDPDIIMIGEIRDKETAEIALQAANTGHLVLSSLHTNSAADAIQRFISLGISPSYIANSISLILAQRLIRKLCRQCKGKTCQNCSKGYLGRTGIFEILPVNEKLSQLILSYSNSVEIKNYMLQNQYRLLHESGHEKVLLGVTTEEEIQRVLI